MPILTLCGSLMACDLTAAECFAKNVMANERVTIVKDRDKQGWYSIRCPGRHHGKPLRVQIGTSCHIFYTDNLPGAGCPETEVFAGLVKLGIPGGCLKWPKDAGLTPQKERSDEKDVRLADAILDIAFGGGTTTERMVAMVVAALDGELPAGPMVGVFAARLGVSERTFYRATAEARRRTRNW